jgi:ATP-binding cassette, subfamily G (WHITE), eye pigment precursor transporter
MLKNEDRDTISYTLSLNEDSPRDSGSDEFSKTFSRSISLRSYNKWSPLEHGVTLAWRDVSVYASKGPKKIKRLINNCSGAITSGSLVALIGASGAGKSTLMSTLAFRNPRDTIVHGDILVNGCQIGPFMRRLSGFVHQDDLFFGSLTVLEHLTCMAHLKLDRRVSAEERKFLIHDIVERTGLMKCLNTRIGEDGEGKMLSGGEKKRLAFATELLTQPAILFCDEPTSGVDSFNSQKLIETLQQLAEKRNTAILCTIHQPSSELFAMFDQVLLLSEGRVAFFGDPEDSIEFFAENGYKCPENFNIAEYLISVISIEHGCGEAAAKRTSKRICDMFAVSEAAQQRDLLVNLEIHMWESGSYQIAKDFVDFEPPTTLSTLWWLTWRFFVSVFRDPKVQYLRILQKIAIGLLAGFIYMGTIDNTQKGVQAIQGIIFLFVSENTFTPMYSTLSIFPQTFPIFLREFKSGLYTVDRYYLANAIALVSC